MYLKDATLRGVFHKIEWEDVLYVIANGDHMTIWMKGRHVPIETCIHLNELIEKYSAPSFMIRTHKSYLVNENCIEKVLFEKEASSGQIFIGGHPLALLARSSEYYLKHFYHGKKRLTSSSSADI